MADVHFQYAESLALDNYLLASGTNGILVTRTGHISDIYIFKPFTDRCISCILQHFDGRPVQMGKLVLGMEAAEMKRSFIETVLSQPSAHFFDHLHVIRPVGHDQVGDLQLDPFFPEDPE